MIGPGTNIAGRYLVEKRVGRGGFASVYLAQDLILQRNVAVKVITPDEAVSDGENAETYRLGDRLLELLSEARFIARHRHNNILDVYDFGQVGEEAYLVMPYASEGTLLQKLRASGPLPFEVAARYLDQMAAGLDYAHSLDVIHRDIKPQNVFVFANEQLVIGDFGLAKVVADSDGFSNTRASGTPSYMPPEQFGGKVGKSSDIYSLGIVVYQMLTGQLPFSARSQAEMMYAHIHSAPPPLRQFRPDIPTSLENLMQKALAKNPIDRPASAGEFARLFRQAIGQAVPPALPYSPNSNEEATINISPTFDLNKASTAPPEIAPSTASGSPGDTAFGGFAGRSRRRRFTPTPKLLRGLGRMALLLLLALGATLYLTNSGSKQTGNISVASNLPTVAPLPTATALFTAASIGESTATPPAIASPVSPTFSPTFTDSPATAMPEAATATVAPPATTAPPPLAPVEQNPTQPPAIQPNVAPTALPTSTAAPALPTNTAAPAPPTNTAVPPATIAPTATPCAIATRRGFGQVYTTRLEIAQKLGCPVEAEQQVTLAYQSYTNGFMLYNQATDQITIFYNSNNTWQTFQNPLRFNDPTPTPFPNAYGCSVPPVSGFGKIWVTQSNIRTRLGCPLAPENSSPEGAIERFAGGTMYFYPTARNGQRILVLFNDSTFLNLPNTFVG